MKAFRTYLLVVALATASFLSVAAAAPRVVWEEVSSPLPSVVQTLDNSETEVAIAVADGYIYVTTEKQVTVKIFSILGQLICQETIKPGTHRIRLASRGIYILRAGATTRRITL